MYGPGCEGKPHGHPAPLSWLGSTGRNMDAAICHHSLHSFTKTQTQVMTMFHRDVTWRTAIFLTYARPKFSLEAALLSGWKCYYAPLKSWVSGCRLLGPTGHLIHTHCGKQEPERNILTPAVKRYKPTEPRIKYQTEEEEEEKMFSLIHTHYIPL